MRNLVPLLGASALLAIFAMTVTGETGSTAWSDEERRLIATLSLSALPPLPSDPSNAVADDPEAAALGKDLFFDKRLSGNGEVACATCHLPDHQFQDGIARARGVAETARRTMPIAGTAYSPWMFWDGRADSQWAQALGPLENPAEHGSDRDSIVRIVIQDYGDAYEDVFGTAPEALPVDGAFANVGKAIAAFERTILPQPSRFDKFADALAAGENPDTLTATEQDGLRLFIGKAGCINCHNGPLLTDQYFHNTGVPAVDGLPADLGRAAATDTVRNDPFNCLGPYSDAEPEECSELAFMQAGGEDLVRAYKTPSLRDVALRAPYMHAGQMSTLADVVLHYSTAPQAPMGHSELEPLRLSREEQANLVAFLATLSGMSREAVDQ